MSNYRSGLLLFLSLLFSISVFGQWEKIYASQQHSMDDVYFITDDIGFMVGRDLHIAKTMDGGKTWKKTWFEDKKSERLAVVEFLDDSVGFAAGFHNVYKTVDQGNNWYRVFGNDTLFHYFCDITVTNDSFIYISGRDADLYSYNGYDDSLIFNYDSFFHKAFPKVATYFPSVKNGYAIAHQRSSPQEGYFFILTTSDSGRTWKKVDNRKILITAQPPAIDLVFLNDSTGYVFFDRSILEVTDYGKSSEVYVESELLDYRSSFLVIRSLLSLDFVTENKGVYYSVSLKDKKAPVVYSPDTFKTWRKLPEFEEEIDLIIDEIEIFNDQIYLIAYTGTECELYRYNLKTDDNTVPAPPSQFSFYPSLNRGSFSIQVPVEELDPESIQIFNYLGQSVRFDIVQQSQSSYMLTLRNFSSGVYFISISEAGFEAIEQFVVIN